MTAEMQLTVQVLIAEKNDLELQILQETNAKNLKHKQSSAEIAELKEMYSDEKTQIRNKIRDLDAKESSDEYKSLLSELEEIKDEEERQVSVIENTATDYENTLQLHIDQDQTRLEAVNADLEQFKEYEKEDVKQSFGYFQN